MNKPTSETKGLRIYTRNLEEGKHPVRETWRAEALELPQFEGGVEVAGELTKLHDRILLELTASAEGKFECTRCADPFTRIITAPVNVSFVTPALETEFEAALETEDDSVHPYDPTARPYVEITEDVRDALALAVPMKHLCKEDCKGICPECGKELNKEDCICAAPEIQEGWSALKGLGERLRAEESKGGKRP
jgi:uncharacterized protein